MSNTLPDIMVPATGVWVDAYAATGITAGQPLIVKNRSATALWVYTGPTAPAVNAVTGWDLATGEYVRVTTVPTGSKVWLRGSGYAFVQLLD